MDERTALDLLPVDKGTKRGPERFREHSRGGGSASQAPGRGAAAPGVLALSGGGEEGVGLLSGGGEVAVVGVQVAAGGLHRGVPEDVLEDVQRDAGVGHPCRPGVAQAVPGEVRQPELRHDAVPVRGVADGRSGEVAALRTDQQRVRGLLAVGEAFQHGSERFEDRHASLFAALGRLRDQATLAGEHLPADHHEVLVEVDIPDLQPRDLRGSGREQRGEHHEVAVGLMDLPTRPGEPVEGLHVGDRVRPRGGVFGGLAAEGVAVQAPLGTVLRGVDLDQSVPHGFIEHPDERGDGVLDGRGTVALFPLINGADR